MITKLRIQQLKSWEDTGLFRLAPFTGFFGTNSSGKTTLLQLLLMLKQTVESSDRMQILHTGDQRSYVDMGTYYDIAHQHTLPATISYEFYWTLQPGFKLDSITGFPLTQLETIGYEATINIPKNSVSVASFQYSLSDKSKTYQVGMSQKKSDKPDNYQLTTVGWNIKRQPGRPWGLPRPIKSYGFPDQISAAYQNVTALSDLVLEFEELFNHIVYLGPLREYPRRIYQWAGDTPQDVGQRGERAVSALLATQSQKTLSYGRGIPRKTVEERIAEWLKELNLIDTFSVKPIAPNRKDYEVRVRRTPTSPEVLLTDVGFGISQILPILVLCYYAPEGATIILEQPEIHLHPSVQAGLADVFIDAIKTRKVQIIVESHSEHLLRRLQRRIAEEAFGQEQAALYFCEADARGTSHLTELELDLFGNITNWPPDFFGDELGETIAMAEAEMKRRQGR
jgi:predicted ATPase